MKLIKILILSACLAFSSVSFSEELQTLPEGVEEIPSGKSVTLEKGEKAPFEGLLLDNAAIAKILVDKEFNESKFKLELEYQKSIDEANIEYLIKQNDIEVETLREKQRVLQEAREKEVKHLMNIIEEKEKQQNDHVWWFIGGLAGGILVATGVSVAVALSL